MFPIGNETRRQAAVDESNTFISSTTDLGDLVRAARLAQGLTRDDVAAATGLSPKFITHVEAGKSTAQIGKVLHLLAELGVRLHVESAVDIPPAITTRAARRRRTGHGS